MNFPLIGLHAGFGEFAALMFFWAFIELIGGRQASFGLAEAGRAGPRAGGRRTTAAQRPTPLPSRLTEEEIRAHAAFIRELGDKAIWYDHLPRPESDPVALTPQ